MLHIQTTVFSDFKKKNLIEYAFTGGIWTTVIHMDHGDWKWPTADSFWKYDPTSLDPCMETGGFYLMTLKSDSYTEC